MYGLPSAKRPVPAERPDLLDSLVGTILSQNTTDVHSRRAFKSLKEALPTWRDVLDADPALMIEAIRSGGALWPCRNQHRCMTRSDVNFIAMRDCSLYARTSGDQDGPRAYNPSDTCSRGSYEWESTVTGLPVGPAYIESKGRDRTVQWCGPEDRCMRSDVRDAEVCLPLPPSPFLSRLSPSRRWSATLRN